MEDRDSERILGVYITQGTAYLALVQSPDQVLSIEPSCIAVSDSEDTVTSLRGFMDAFRSEVRRYHVFAVAVAHPLLYRWGYTEAFRRVSLETAIILACQAESVRYVSVELHGALKASGIIRPPKGISVPKQAAAHLKASSGLMGDEPHWNERCVALLAAVGVASGNLPAPKAKRTRKRAVKTKKQARA